MFAGIVVGVIALLFPGALLGSAWASKKLSGKPMVLKKVFSDHGYALIPLGIMLWIGFGLTLFLVNWSYIPVVVSDPFGFGWNLFGTRDVPWTPITWVLPNVIATFSILGMILSLDIGWKISLQMSSVKRQAIRPFLPFAVFVVAVTLLYQSFFL